MSKTTEAKRNSNAAQEEKQQKKHKKHSKQYSEEPTEEETATEQQEEQPKEETDEEDTDLAQQPTQFITLKYIRFAEMFIKSMYNKYEAIDINKTYCATIHINSVSAQTNKDGTIKEDYKTIKFTVYKISYLKNDKWYNLKLNDMFNDFHAKNENLYCFNNCFTDYINVKDSYLCDTTDNGVYTITFKIILGTNSDLTSDINKCYLIPRYSKGSKVINILKKHDDPTYKDYINKLSTLIPKYVSESNYIYRERPKCTIKTFDIHIEHDLTEDYNDIE